MISNPSLKIRNTLQNSNRAPHFEILLIGLWVLAIQNVVAEESQSVTARSWLTSMVEAMHTLNYQGTAVYLRDDQVETMKVFHAVENGIEQERFVSLNDPMREVIRDADKVTCYFPDTQTIVVDYKPHSGSVLFNVPNDLNSESRRYRTTIGHQAHVVQRLTQVISIDPMDNLRYARKIWIDIESKLPLKYEVYDEGGKRVEQMVFTSFSVEETIPLKFLSATTKIGSVKWRIRDKENIPAHKHDWEFKSIPQGFKQVLYTRKKMPASKHPVEHILFSDGVASVSVYVDESENDRPLQKELALGVINSYSRQYMNHRITVMGEVPAKTVKIIGDSIYIQKPGGN